MSVKTLQSKLKRLDIVSQPVASSNIHLLQAWELKTLETSQVVVILLYFANIGQGVSCHETKLG